MEISLAGKTALVTGASRGIGRAITEVLIKAGCSKLYAVCILKQELEQLAAEFSNVTAVHLDLSNWSATEETISTLEPVDCLVNNAGLLWPTPPGNICEADFDKMNAVNVKAVINVTQIVSGKMVEAGRKGSIVNLSSITSMKGYPKFMIYCSTKATVDHITHMFASQLAPKGIRVNAVNPWIVDTKMGRAVYDNNSEEAETYLKATPLGRFNQPIDIARAVLFLLSDWSAMITGATLPIDGGLIL